MTPFEEELKRAMQHKEPPEHFAARVLARAAREPKLNAEARFRIWRLAPAMAALLMMSGAGIYKQHQRAARGEAAKEKLLVAVYIAGSKLHHAQHRIFDVETEEVRQ